MGGNPQVPLPAAGEYPTLDHHRKHVVERAWDGAVWQAEHHPAAADVSLPHHKRHFFGFLHHPKILIGFIGAAAGATALWLSDRKADWVSGEQVALPLLSFVATAVVMAALLLFLNRRVGFDRIPPEKRREIARWGLLSAVVGFALAYGFEVGVPELFGSSAKKSGWSALAGPAEETGKLLVPAILWFRGRFRLPREGYLLVLISASTMGAIESAEYALNPDKWQPQRMILEIMHPLLTGFVAAVAWQAAWKGKSLFTAAGIGAWVVAMIAHSTNDVIVLERHADKGVDHVLSLVTLAVVIGMYLLQKHSASQLVPPDKVASVSRRWRPAAPRDSRTDPA